MKRQKRSQAVLAEFEKSLKKRGRSVYQILPGLFEEHFGPRPGGLYLRGGRRMVLYSGWGGLSLSSQEFGIRECQALRKRKAFTALKSRGSFEACPHVVVFRGRVRYVCVPLRSGRKIFAILYQETTEVELVERIAEMVSNRLGPIADQITD